ncbi:hypothetical protein CsSME_00026925 [Camellia sinensis var. sinensis]
MDVVEAAELETNQVADANSYEGNYYGGGRRGGRGLIV